MPADATAMYETIIALEGLDPNEQIRTVGFDPAELAEVAVQVAGILVDEWLKAPAGDLSATCAAAFIKGAIVAGRMAHAGLLVVPEAVA